MQHDVIHSGGKLTINAEGSTTIDGPFEVQLGGELEINQ